MRFLALLLAATLSCGALAQNLPLPPTPAPLPAPLPPLNAITNDFPIGFPYNTGDFPNKGGSGAIDASQVPLRDYLSSRIDQLRAEVFDRMDALERQQSNIVDERDRQYAQRFAAQQEAISAALSSAREAVASALAAAKEAVSKAEAANDKRFDSVNEFRQTLADQTADFVTKDTSDAKFEAIELRFRTLEQISHNNSSRLDSLKAVGEGYSDLTGWVFGGILVLLGVGGFLLNYRRGDGRPSVRR